MSPPQVRLPLFVKILAWLTLNLVLAAGVLFAFAAHDQSGLNMLLTQSVRDRVASIARNVGDSIYDVSNEQRLASLRRASQQYGLQFSAHDLRQPAPMEGPPGDGRPPPPPDRDPREAGQGPPGPPDQGPGPRHAPHGPGPRDVLIDIHPARNGPGYDVSVDLEIARGGRRPRRIELGLHAENISQLLYFLGLERGLTLLAALLILSALFWWPFVWHITRAIQQVLAVTQEMARGKLDARVHTSRRDELGHLAVAVNTMGERLQAQVQGQRQFMADVAHEVISPVSRIQIALGILETQVPERSGGTVNDIREDLDQMSGMLNELLLFARSGVESDRHPPVSIDLRKLVGAVVTTETGKVPVVVDVDADLRVKGHAAPLQRALSNLLRNAQRYAAGSDAPIGISAWPDEARIHITVSDRGPGVPEDALSRLGEPFFRPETARSRATGGFGIGLAIVCRCVSACDGEVTFRNRDGGGFEAAISLQRAD